MGRLPRLLGFLGLLTAPTLVACEAPVWGEASCDPRTLEHHEVRARRVACDAELVAGGDGRVNDWLLENSLIRLVFRHAGSSRTILGAGGGTLIDAAAPGGADMLVELVPLISGSWLEAVEVEAWQGEGVASLTVSGTPMAGGGGAVTVTWTLEAGSAKVEVEGAERFWLYPASGARVSGPMIHAGSRVMAMDGEATDTGGGIVFDGGTAFSAGEAGEVVAGLWPGGRQVAGVCSCDGVEALAGGEVVGWLPADKTGTFSGPLPAGAEGVRAVSSGYGPGVVEAPGQDLDISPGTEGGVDVRASADGRGLPAHLLAMGADGGEVAYAIPPEGRRVPLPPGEWDLVLSAGPLRHRAVRERLRAGEEARLEADLPGGEPPGWLLAALDVEAWPSRDLRGEPADAHAGAVAGGARYVVMTAPDEVGRVEVEQPWGSGTRARSGSRVESDVGAVRAWPWTANSRKPASGAVDWRGLDAEDLLAAASGGPGRGRVLAVDSNWVKAAGDPYGWSPAPHLLIMDGLEDLPVLLDLLDRWVALGVAGPYTWVPVDDPECFAAVEVEAAMVEGRTVASSGPLLSLEVLEHSATRNLTAKLHLEAPPWMLLTGAALVVDGEILRSWDLAGLEASPRLEAWVDLSESVERYALAMAWGDEDPGHPSRGVPWVVTGPTWIGSPGAGRR